MIKQEVIPKTLWLTTNNNCNNNCRWCYAANQNFKNQMTKQKIFEVVDYFKKNNIKKIVLIGGEPTIFKDIIEIVKYISDNGIDVSMASNGRKFSDFHFAETIFNSGLKKVNISIKGASEKEYQENTNSLGYKEMLKGYKNLLKLGGSVTLSYVLCNPDTKTLDDFINVIKKEKLDHILFQLYKPSVERNKNYDAPSIFDLSKLVTYAYDKLKNTDIDFKFEMSIPLCCLDEKLLNELIDNNQIITCCHIRKGSGIILDTNFNLLPCNHFVNHPINKIPVDINDIVDYWNGCEAVNFRNAINTYPSLMCKECKKWKKCGGGCFLHWLNENPKTVIDLKGGDKCDSIRNS